MSESDVDPNNSNNEESWKDSDFLRFDSAKEDHNLTTTTYTDDNHDDNHDNEEVKEPSKKRPRITTKNHEQNDTCVILSSKKKSERNRNTRISLDSTTSTTTSGIAQRKRKNQKSSMDYNNNNSNHNNMDNEDNDTTTRLPPWMDRPPEHTFRYNTPKLILLHEEIVQFVNLMKPQPAEIQIRNTFVQKVKDLILNLFNGHENANANANTNGTSKETNANGSNKEDDQNCEVHVFGSQATGLLLPSSDVDFVVMLPGYETETPQNDTSNNDKDKTISSTSSKSNNNTKETKELKDKTLKTTKSTTKQEELKEMEEYDIQTHLSSHFNDRHKSPLQKLANELIKKWKNELTYIEVVENTKVPIVKFTHGPTKLSADICFNQYNGVQAAELMKRFMDVMPPLRPLTFVLKYFMAVRGLNEPYSGGCGSFMLQLMIVSFLQHRERYDYNNYLNHQRQRGGFRHNSRHSTGGGRRDYRDRNDEYDKYDKYDEYDEYDDDSGYVSAPMNLGSLLMEFFELYGMDFNYLTTAISVRNDGYYFPKGHHNRREYFFTNPSRAFTLGIENPTDITMDVGKSSFRMALIQKSFEVALRVLLSHVSQPAVPTDSILGSIIPPTEEMYERATLNKVLNIENKLNQQGYRVNERPGGSSRKKPDCKRRRSSTESSMDMSDSSG